MKKRLRMVLGGPRGGLGGAQRIVESLERRLEADGWTVEWFGPANLSRIPASRRYPGLNEALRTLAVGAALRKLPRADLTLSHGTYGLGAPGRRIHVHHGTFAGLADACRAGLPNLDYQVMRRLNGGLEAWSGRGATNVVVSERVAGEIARNYGIRRSIRIHNGVDVSHLAPQPDRRALRARWGLPEDRFLAAVVGRMDYGKGWKVLQALDTLLPPTVHFALAAPPDGSSRLLPGRMTVIPGVPYPELPSFYGACDALLCPSLYEGFGLTLIEAWACGLPVVTGRVGIVGELTGREAAFDRCVADVADAPALAAALVGLREAPEQAQRQAEWGRELAHRRFSLERFQADYLDLINRTLDGVQDGVPAVAAP